MKKRQEQIKYDFDNATDCTKSIVYFVICIFFNYCYQHLLSTFVQYTISQMSFRLNIVNTSVFGNSENKNILFEYVIFISEHSVLQTFTISVTFVFIH